VLDQNEQAEVVETEQDVATEPEDRPAAADDVEEVESEMVAPETVSVDAAPVDTRDGLGALMRAVEEAEADLAGDEAAPVEADDAGDSAPAVAEVGVDAEVLVADVVVAEVEAVGEVEDASEVMAEDAPEPVVPAPAPPAEDDGMHWYVIHTYSGYERKVKQSLEERVRTLGLEKEVAELLIPTEDVVEMKSGRKVVTAKKFFPGYLLIRMDMNEDLWHVVKNTPRVTGFVGAGRKPIPLPQEEVDKIVNRMEESVEAPKPKFQFRKNETVRIIDGPFTNFTGKVEEVDSRRSTLKVMVSIFGRNTPVELDFFQVEKV